MRRVKHPKGAVYSPGGTTTTDVPPIMTLDTRHKKGEKICLMKIRKSGLISGFA